MRIVVMFLLYFLATLFPGFLCSHILRLVMVTEQRHLVDIVSGVIFTISPYLILPILLIFLAWLGVFRVEHPERYSLKREQQKRLIYLALFVCFLWITISTSNTIMRDKMVGEGVYWMHLCGAWMMGYFSGLIILMTYVIRKLRAYNKTADLT